MSYAPFYAEIITNSQVVFTGEVALVTCDTPSGEITILAHHTPAMIAVKSGSLRIEEADGNARNIWASNGVIEVAENKLTALIEQGMDASELSEQDILKAKELIEEKMQAASANDKEGEALNLQLADLVAQLKVVNAIRRDKKL